MYRISTDAEYLESGKIVVDADGIPVNLGYRGTGSPVGKVSAPVGSVYTDAAATNGAIRWIKTRGTGNTGWKVEYGDTGWRDVSSSIEDRMSPLEFTDGAKLLVRRIGDLAYLKISGRVYVRSQFGKLCDNFTGFRPEGYSQFNLSKSADINAGVYQIRVESGTVDGALTSGGDRSIMGYWDVAQAWPSSLPGTPA